MKSRDERIAEEAAALWREVFGGAPPPKTDASAMLQIITGALPDLKYDRMRSPHLRPSQISRPGDAGHQA
jgi:hypothetical protein